MDRLELKNIVRRNKQVYILLVLASFILLYSLKSFATAAPVIPTKTNINEVTNEFEMHITNKKDLDIQTEDLKNIGIKASESPNISDLLSADDLAKMSSEQNRLSSISENELETQGSSVRYSKENAFFDEMEVDFTRPGAMAHLKDAEEIADATEKKIGELTKFLRDELKINCTEVDKSPEVKDPYYIEIEKEQTKEVEYDQKFCEHLRNQYTCSDDLVMKCEHPVDLHADLQPETNIDFRYDLHSNDLILGNSAGHHVGKGKVFNYHFNFQITDVAQVKKFTLNHIKFDDLVLVKLNGQKVYSGHVDGIERLELRTDKHFGSWRKYFYGVQIDDNKDHVITIEHNAYRHRDINKDLKPLLKNGTNKIEITLAIGGWGAVVMNMSYALFGCSKWNEEWNEICTLK